MYLFHIHVYGVNVNINFLYDNSKTITSYSHSNNTTSSVTTGSYNSNPALIVHYDASRITKSAVNLNGLKR